MRSTAEYLINPQHILAHLYLETLVLFPDAVPRCRGPSNDTTNRVAQRPGSKWRWLKGKDDDDDDNLLSVI
jgi:hypothetical protein